jgi:hypothetical protein
MSHIACYHGVIKRQIRSWESPDDLVRLPHPREAVTEVANVRTGRSLAISVAGVTIQSDRKNQSDQVSVFEDGSADVGVMETEEAVDEGSTSSLACIDAT